MKELVTVEQAERVIAILALALPVAGALLGVIVGAIRRRIASSAVVGLTCGLAGPAILLMWRIYNSIIGRYGLDSVRGLLINLALFVVVGLVIGAAVGLVARRRTREVGEPAVAAAVPKNAKRR